MKSENIKKILVIRFSSLGDVLLTTPLLKSIKEQFPAAEVHYIVKNKFSETLANNPNVNKIIAVDDNIDFNGLKELKRSIRNEKYDIIVDAHNSLRSFYLRLFQPAKKLKFKKYSFRKFLLVKFKINLMKDLPPVINRYINTLGLDTESHGLPEIFTTQSAKECVDKLLSGLNLSHDKKLICIAPSSAHFTKTYPPEYYISLIKLFDKNKFTIVLTGRGNDKKTIDTIMSSVGENVFNFCDKLTISELAGLIRKSNLFISGDTGPMHVAEAVGTNLVMLAGSSVREFGFYPQNKNSAVIEKDGLKCRPCSHIGRSECPLGHFKCMRDIAPEQIYKEAKKLLN